MKKKRKTQNTPQNALQLEINETTVGVLVEENDAYAKLRGNC